MSNDFQISLSAPLYTSSPYSEVLYICEASVFLSGYLAAGVLPSFSGVESDFQPKLAVEMLY
jgi:hypothetical protein